VLGAPQNRDGRSGRAQAELGSEECTRRRRSSRIDALLTVPITASCWVRVVDKAGATRCGRRPRIVFGAYGIVALAAPKAIVLRERWWSPGGEHCASRTTKRAQLITLAPWYA